MTSVRFPGKPFNITVIQVYAPTTNAEETETEWFYESLQDLLELTPKKRYLFHRESEGGSEFAQPCLTLCEPMNRSTPGLPVHHQLLEFTQIHINTTKLELNLKFCGKISKYSEISQYLLYNP